MLILLTRSPCSVKACDQTMADFKVGHASFFGFTKPAALALRPSDYFFERILEMTLSDFLRMAASSEQGRFVDQIS